MKNLLTFKIQYKEIAYQTAIIAVLGIFFSYNQDYQEHIRIASLLDLKKLAFFANYMVAAVVINYYLLPAFYYKKKLWLFCFSVCLLIALVVLVDEFVLEKIYYPHTRGVYFPGIAYTLIETLPVIIIAVAFKLAWDYNKKEREFEKLKALVKESQLQFLKNQINPHFLFNNLNNLYAHAISNSPQTPGIIVELSSVLRYNLYDCKEDYVPLAKELKHLQHYTALHELQIAQRGKVNVSMELASENFTISPLILVVFIENAFKHSAVSLIQDIAIFIDICVDENGLLTMHCNNNFSPDYALKGHVGIGLENVKKRLLLLYPKMHELAISVVDNMYQVKLSIQLKSIESC
ncbi:MAG: histidine kinase [Cytophagaceae bacterium]|jgi:sensor histidine kinase YesM|nr:histidine kinase [Cytophagaceae bacterium]